jgi:glucans biosynthesis protein
MHWTSDAPARPPGGRVFSTRRDRGNFYLWHIPENERGYRYLIDFDGEALAKLAPDAKIEAVVSVGETGKLVEQQLMKNPVNQRWRLSFLVKPVGKAPVELRAFLRGSKETLTETWSYTLEP